MKLAAVFESNSGILNDYSRHITTLLASNRTSNLAFWAEAVRFAGVGSSLRVEVPVPVLAIYAEGYSAS